MKKAILISGLIGLILIAACASVREFALVQDMEDGATVRLRGKVVSEEFWLGNRNAFERAAVKAGGWQMHLYMAENIDDYVWCLFEIEEDGRLVFDENTRLAFVYEDGLRVISEELIFAEGHKEKQIFVTTQEIVGLTAGNNSRYGRSHHGGYLASVRFHRGSLPEGGKWGYVPPERIEILRREECGAVSSATPQPSPVGR